VAYVGGIPIGGGNPVIIQSMTDTDTRDAAATIAQIKRLEAAGCEVVRVAVPDTEAAQAIPVIKKAIQIPLVADIHFDYRLALLAVKYGADKLRINPGNIGGKEKVKQVAQAAKAAGIPIRVGVNGGSLEKGLLKKYGGPSPRGLAESAFGHIALMESFGFYDLFVSLKATDIPLMVDAHRILAESCPYPLHIGLTEAGTPYKGALRSAAGIGALLAMGIGDTVRVSLTGDPVQEVLCAREIVQAMGLRRFGARVISCPACGRTEIDLTALAAKVEDFCQGIQTPLTVAVMGCAVNGPGEAREADIGVAGGKGEGVLFRKGVILGKVPESELEEAIKKEIRRLA
jgi:(E)-4-hydroxy-3-methylbut-2-enyl-diphosphate synthase